MKKRLSSLVSSSFNGASCKSNKEELMDIDNVYQAAQPTQATRRTAAVVAANSGCRCVRRQGRRTRRRSVPAIDIGEDDMSRARETPAYLWSWKEEKWAEALASSEEPERRKIIDEEEDDEDEDEDEDQDKVPLTIDLTKTRRTRDMVIHQRRSLIKSRSRISTSSCGSSSFCSSEDDNDNDDDEENYETEDGAEEEDSSTLLSALSLTTSTANYSSSIARPRNRSASPEPRVIASASAVGMLKKLVPCAADEGKVQESFAVVKKSEDPRGDFRRSMAEMVAEKGIYDAADLEQLLRCFLSLNSRHHHRAIVTAFSDIWQTLFPDNSPNFTYEH